MWIEEAIFLLVNFNINSHFNRDLNTHLGKLINLIGDPYPPSPTHYPFMLLQGHT